MGVEALRSRATLQLELPALRNNLRASFDDESREDALEDIPRVWTSAGGARAKAVIAWNENTNEVRSGQTHAGEGFDYGLPSPAFDVTYSSNPSVDWTAVHQMSMNGKQDAFNMEDFRACAKTASMKRGRAEAGVEEVRTAVAAGEQVAQDAGVCASWRGQIRQTPRSDIPRKQVAKRTCTAGA